ncbi:MULTISPECIES: division/cell wall cluster transcriptional repressor MraZ [Gordonibacter]|uniref:Transcriptional regulator MraZ n=1 Tax=Gordonibacter faecis TaxID=3047475 RepID=A0ABT7DRR4_9ACTN|nr:MULTISPECIES: division/cell wall cluster transcriptional repressor MraZ [unclassified Gordonibacter]MDJ1650870.1 division/cell wall cluster transcriptional repressor MraZ [Gordonibacter sp. KGMB12511]HIW76126.1 division/cell wall cluster transcriptional repressor MraZ [Candidatus Gordonibacter avicola]
MADVVDTAEGTKTTRIVDLNGEYRFKVDAKGRMSLPAKFRKALSSDLVVTRNPKDECLYVFEPEAFNNWVIKALEDKFGKFDSTNDLHVRLRRKLKSRAKDVEVDGSGRIMLPSEARAATGIDKDVAVVGNTGYFEIWDAKRYEMQDDDTDLSLLFG